MGYGSWNSTEYAATTRSFAAKPLEAIYTSKSIKDVYDPKKIGNRESRDSEKHPAAKPVIIGLDVSASMGMIAKVMAKTALGPIVQGLLDNFTEFSPHIMFAAFGDAVRHDDAPLQLTQFEADTVILQQLTELWLEGGGGGNCFESNDLVWAAAAFKTATDEWEKRKQKGYLFTVGDEEFPKESESRYYTQALGLQPMSPMDSLEAAQLRYNVFHVMVGEGHYASRRITTVRKSWEPLGKRALWLTNHEHIAPVILSAIQLEEGEPLEEVLGQWSEQPEVLSTVATAIDPSPETQR